MADVKVPGVRINLGGADYIVPPLTLGQLEKYQPALASVDVTNVKAAGTIIDVAHAALTRNYPDITRDEVANLVDVSTMREVMEAAMDVSSLKRKAQEAWDKTHVE